MPNLHIRKGSLHISGELSQVATRSVGKTKYLKLKESSKGMKDLNKKFISYLEKKGWTVMPENSDSVSPDNDGIDLYYPEPNDEYIRREEDVVVEKTLEAGLIPFLIGDAGSGKTECLRQYAAEHEMPYFSFTLDGSISVREVIGHQTLSSNGDGNTSVKFQEGLFIKYLREPSLIALEEVNATPPGLTFLFHQLFQSGQFYSIDSNETYTRHPKCLIAATGNLNSSLYGGLQKMNYAFIDRMTLVYFPKFDFDKIEILGKQHVDNVREFVRSMISTMESSRGKTPMTIRRIKNYNNLLKNFCPEDEDGNVDDSVLTNGQLRCLIEMAFLNPVRYNEEHRYDDLNVMAKSIFGFTGNDTFFSDKDEAKKHGVTY